jgi:hypothetical protein
MYTRPSLNNKSFRYYFALMIIEYSLIFTEWCALPLFGSTKKYFGLKKGKNALPRIIWVK